MEKITERIIDFNKGRVPEMIQLKYEAMAENLFRFYRGSNHIFYEDLKISNAMPDAPVCWISGDLHLENFGSYRSDNRLVYFDLNDFDEAALAPCSWELVRVLTSIFIAFESLQIEQKKALNIAQLFIKRYASHLSLGKPSYIERQTSQGIVRDFLVSATRRKQKSILHKRTVEKKHKLEIMVDDPRHFELKKKLKKELYEHITLWLKNNGESPYNYKVTDVVFRMAGTGSLGVHRYAFLLKSLNNEGERHLLIDMKQCVASSVQKYCAVEQPAWNNEAERVAGIQTCMQNRPPALLSTTIFRDESYLIQEMQPVKDSINFKLIKRDYRAMCRVIEDMAMLTASSQLRSTGRRGSAITDELIAFGKAEHWQAKILQYALSYAQQVKTDYMFFLKDYHRGLLKNVKEESKVLVRKEAV